MQRPVGNLHAHRWRLAGGAFSLAALAGCSVLSPSDSTNTAGVAPSASASASESETRSGSASPDGGSFSGTAPAPSRSAVAPSATAGTSRPGGLEDVPQVAATLAPSVVTVLVPSGNGSGVVYSPDGLIVTNEHVVRGNRTVEIAFADGQRVAGTVRAVDAVTDLALVQANRRNLPAATFQTRLPVVGSLAVVIGAPLGFQNSVTAGVVSGLHRELPGSAAQGGPLVDLLQTDAPISPGNSGGAVANAAGQVIGISEAYVPPQSGAVALGFAIPAATVVDVANQLQSSGRVQHAFAGVQPAEITAEIAEQFGLASRDGVIIAEVVANGPAARAGLQPGDVITKVDGTAVRSPGDFLAVIRRQRPEVVIAVTVTRSGGADREIRITLASRPIASAP